MGNDLDSKLVSSLEDHRFCYVYWEHGRNGTASIYYLDAPVWTKVEPVSRFAATGELNDLVEKLKQLGWQEFSRHANQEAYERWLIRPNYLDDRYEHQLMTCTLFTNGSQPTDVTNLFYIGAKNQNVILSDLLGWKPSFEKVVAYLEQEGWEFTHNEDFQRFQNLPNVFIHQRYYRRLLK